MENKKLNGLFQQLAGEQHKQASADLWPAIYHSLVEREPQKQGASRLMNKKSIWSRPVWAAAGMSIVLLLAFFTITPAGRAMAQDIIHFFTPEESNSVQVSTAAPAPLVEVQPVAPEVPVAAVPVDCNESSFPSCPLDEIKSRVPFTIAYPANLPADYKFAGAKALDSGVVMTFDSPKGSYYLYEMPIQADGLKTSPVGKAAEIIATTVNGKQAEYVEGSWMGASQADGSIPWSDNDYLRTLAWADEGLEYRLVSVGAKVHDSARPSVEEMVAVAVSIDPAAPLPLAQSGSTSLAEAEKQAGFDFIEPSFLPPATYPSRAVYNPANAVICNYYQDAHATDGVMILAESEAGLWSPYDFKVGMVDNGSGQTIEIQMFVEHVDMPGVLNGKAIYMSNGIRPGKLCGNEDDIANQALIWHKDGRSYYLFGQIDNLGYGYVTRMEMERMAAELADLPAAEKAIDPERVLSLMDAELLWGDKVPFPSRMLAGMKFDHIQVRIDEALEWNSLTMSFVKKPVTELVDVYITREMTKGLDSYKNHTSYTETQVWGLTGYESIRCSEDPLTREQNCNASLIWQDEIATYEMHARSQELLTSAQLLEIAESMKP